jgi:signal transduction histidine kinase
LKTPITVISGYADALCAGKVPPEEVDRYLRAIQQKSTVLVDLIGEFSEYGKVEHPQFKLHRIKTDFCEFVRSYLVRHYDEIDLNGFSLEVDIPENPQYVLLDEFQFLRVLDNLVSNSLKHNRLGTVLSVDVVPLDESVVLRFADNGARIQGNQAKRIFEPFVTGDAARSNPGSGLGLSISRRIVELHGGTIALSPSPHHGRTNEFVITLPTLR